MRTITGCPRSGTRFPAAIRRSPKCTPTPTHVLRSGRRGRVPFNGTAPEWTLEIYRDGYRPEVVHRVEAIEGVFAPTPKDAYRSGCGWPVSHRWRLPDDLRSGFYRVVSTLRPRERRQVHPASFLRGPPHRKNAQGENPDGAADRDLDRLQRFWRRLSLLSAIAGETADHASPVLIDAAAMDARHRLAAAGRAALR